MSKDRVHLRIHRAVSVVAGLFPTNVSLPIMGLGKPLSSGSTPQSMTQVPGGRTVSILLIQFAFPTIIVRNGSRQESIGNRMSRGWFRKAFKKTAGNKVIEWSATKTIRIRFLRWAGALEHRRLR